jgi:carbonic anhydrase
MKPTTFVAVLICLAFTVVRGHDWNYDDASPEGPSYWVDTYPSCGGANQSPINVITSAAQSLPGPTSFTFTNYERIIPASPFTIVNNGHSAMIQVNLKDITISGAGLPSTYVLEQFHLHWGENNGVGSEHLVDSVAHPLEIHFVHYNSALYPDVATAAASGNPQALAVLGVFVDIDDNKPTPEIASIVDHVAEVLYADDSKFITPFSVANLLPQSALNSYFRYSGSLTTPGCSEVVIWTLFTQPMYATSAQLNTLRQLRANVIGDPDEAMTRNYRPVQPVNSRTVYRA